MQPVQLVARAVCAEFQSSSGQKAGCNQAAKDAFDKQKADVSILIRPEGRMQLAPENPALIYNRRVSILIRPEGRMQREVVRHVIAADADVQSSSGQKAGCNLGVRLIPSERIPFQSSSGQKAGCNPPTASTCGSTPCFNPHPTRRPDATCSGRYRCRRPYRSFNPHPARRPDATPVSEFPICSARTS